MSTFSDLSPEAMAKYRRAFEKRVQARFQSSEKRRQQARQAVHAAVAAVMPRYPPVRQVYLFGSILKPGAFRADSDLDIGLVGADMALCFDIWRDLEQAIPEWTLDVRSLDPADAFSERVRAKGELIYERPVTDP